MTDPWRGVALHTEGTFYIDGGMAITREWYTVLDHSRHAIHPFEWHYVIIW